MPLKVEKKENESSWNLIKRFSQKMRKSGILTEAKKGQYREKSLSDKLKKRAALRRENKKREYEQLKKMGKL